MDTIVPEPSDKHRTKRRYAHELYPHPEEYTVRPLAVEVPYRYARAIGLSVHRTSWRDQPPEKIADRFAELIAARELAFVADALLQGKSGQEAWTWAMQRANDETGEWTWDRAVNYGVDPGRIKPYDCGPEPDHHYHESEPDARGWSESTRIEGKESECPECCEPIEPKAGE